MILAEKNTIQHCCCISPGSLENLRSYGRLPEAASAQTATEGVAGGIPNSQLLRRARENGMRLGRGHGHDLLLEAKI